MAAGFRAKEDRTGKSRESRSLWKAFREKISLRLNMTQESTFTEKIRRVGDDKGVGRHFIFINLQKAPLPGGSAICNLL